MLSRTFVLLRNLNALRYGAVAKIVETRPLANNATPITFAKHFCSNPINIPVVSYEEIKQLPKQPEKLLIDVREPKELQETGQIPTSINIPLGQVATELADNVDAGAFKAKYGRDFPTKNTEIIFHCKIGRRSQNAAEIAYKLGFEKSKNYLGSWTEWAEKEGLPK
uniref:Heat shock protein 67b.2 n=1 Tax=Musca domestica TaxID=7370 RepID=A0A1X9JSU3_MUSDO|nr:heat shock protein 67b.2 [Musca domestica]